jgi:hyperosmotically inducible protein
MRQALIAVSLAVVAAAALHASAGTYPPDNTGTNARDRNGHTLTATDQSESKADLHITQQVRKAIVADKGLSTNAHNVKAITAKEIFKREGAHDIASTAEASVKEPSTPMQRDLRKVV